MLFYGRVPTKEKHKDEYKPIRTFAMYGIGGGGRCRQQLKIIPVLPKHVVHFLWDSCLIFSSWGDYQWGYLLALIEIMAMIAIFISLQIHSKVSHSDIGLLNKWLWGSCETSPEMKGAWMFVYSCPHCTYIIFCAATSLFYHFLRWLRVSRKDVAGLLHFVQITSSSSPPPILTICTTFLNAKNVYFSDIQNDSSKILLRWRQKTCFSGHVYTLKTV